MECAKAALGSALLPSMDRCAQSRSNLVVNRMTSASNNPGFWQSVLRADRERLHFERSVVSSRDGPQSGRELKSKGSVCSATWRGAISEMHHRSFRVVSLSYRHYKFV